MANSQHRCVFVGNIPYDASEEQLIQICEEVGPVVSFRLVLDRETGKPKGYGFCEYKDEETALSARRNLQGYAINGRQLRVDFAENDKGIDKSREQGRGGPGIAGNVDIQNQPKGLVDSSLQPFGMPSAIAAASVMAGTLGGVQTGIKSNQNGMQNQISIGSDPLTLHLSKMSRNQLNNIMSELKEMATQNRELAHQLLSSNPQLPKALFQAQIMMGMVSPQKLQIPNIPQASYSKPSTQEAQHLQQSSVQILPGIPSIPQNSAQFAMMPEQVSQIPALSQSSLIPNKFCSLPQLLNNQVIQPSTLRPQTLNNLPDRPQIQKQPSLPQHTAQLGPVNLGYSNQLPTSNSAIRPSQIHPSLSETGFKSSMPIKNNSDRTRNLSSMTRDISEPMNYASKVLKLDDGRSVSNSLNPPLVPSGSGLSHGFAVGTLPVNQISSQDTNHPDKKLQLLPEIESALLHQVMNLTPGQLSSLPLDQQQQVIELQQMLR